MKINFLKINQSSVKSPIEPRDIFMSLPQKAPEYSYPRDVQAEVWKQWFSTRDQKNNILKMNTGSGKTVVGLMILQSCLNEKKGPAVYIVPDNYLVKQVFNEAKKLGIPVVSDNQDKKNNMAEKGEQDYRFKEGNAIFVTNIHKLVNGKSIFGLQKDKKVSVGSILIDDVHACLDTIEQQHTILIEKKLPLYTEMLNIFSSYSEINDKQSFFDIKDKGDPRSRFIVPFWVWQKECAKIRKMITSDKYATELFMTFKFPLMKDNWATCNCVVSNEGIELTLKGVPISKILSFEQAKRRIFMSATLSDDSVFVTSLGLKREEMGHVITPEKANDIGERLILAPQYLNSKIEDAEIKKRLISLSNEWNVVVIVPSFARVDFWKDAKPKQILSSRDENIDAGIELLKKNKHGGITIIVNRYDGIDLPQDACRILVLDGLPPLRSGYDIAIQGINPKDRRIHREQIQKIEQGMGRGVRSNNDFCVVVLMGKNLVDILAPDEGGFFSSATEAQINLSRQIWAGVIEEKPFPSVADIFSLTIHVLGRDSDWIKASKEALASIEYSRTINIDSISIARRKAFEMEELGRYDKAFLIIEEEKNKSSDNSEKGLLMQLMAEYKNFTNPAEAQTLLSTAKELNSMVLTPISGIQSEKEHSSASAQAEAVQAYIRKNNLSGNAYVLKVTSALNNLTFGDVSYKKFEQALEDLGNAIGFSSSRPEKEHGGKAPDNMFVLGNSAYAIFECKNESTAEAISKDDCRQLLGSRQWFLNHYKDSTLNCYPIIVHKSEFWGKDASPHETFKIITPKLLDELKKAIKSFAYEINKPDVIANVGKIEELLMQFSLNGKQFVEKYTVSRKKIIS